MNKNSDSDFHKLIDKTSDVFYKKHWFEADIVFIIKSYYLKLLWKKHDLIKSMGRMAKHLADRSVLGFEIRLHRRKTIILMKYKK